MKRDATLRETLRDAACQLSAAGIDESVREARLLMSLALETDLGGLLRRAPDEVLTGPEATRFSSVLTRRRAREPLAFIAGEAGFWTLTLSVTPDTLIPRADSETLIEALCDARPGRAAVRSILDLGTGTGCLLLAALHEFPFAQGVGVDLSPGAAALARRNAERNALDGRAVFLAGSWDTALAGRFDVILSNPPYIPHADLRALMPEVVAYEPARALDGGDDGLDAYRALAALLPARLNPGGVAVLEIGIGQDTEVCALATAAGLTVREVRTDLGGIARAVVLEGVTRG
ncbi:modification methylase HemK [Ameyamaea chiangmaiensis NBRC 103196]|uniref:Release factor glutamine methyltransferase n=1 Tax=Ameyamaea chiangmaiensis TaxID=442969 RepID=A0A850P763_9PROT|nr:peptide chain release factor N(5)-glutamine methyltransferase [Ameyamaea chiangmaiensis]MBS4073730.1 peptide chain release factor N(5)-glutamine methyltransferase [Ameyamaea chiangmaiensis]NVN39778.1 peptide chain release factor N(5)-glutamine methyltransferase [Ameyamaea chiangmaiensis]GBQ68659.1 modification methylase HemK [Ameyamaea chiangmaiensis NBRC 103196]